MGVLKCRNPRNGVVYVYTYEYDVDPATGKKRQHRHCIGHIDEATGETVPNAPTRGRPRGSGKNAAAESDSQQNPVPAEQYETIVRQLNEARAENVTLKQEIAVVRQENIELRDRQERMIHDIQAAISG